MYVAMPWLEDADEPACRAWAQIEILASTAFAILQKISIVNVAGDPRRLLTDYRLLRQSQLSYERELAMTPASRMAIKATGTRAAFDLPAEMAKTNAEDAEEVKDDETGNG
jgi:hypothetical protein